MAAYTLDQLERVIPEGYTVTIRRSPGEQAFAHVYREDSITLTKGHAAFAVSYVHRADTLSEAFDGALEHALFDLNLEVRMDRQGLQTIGDTTQS